MRRLILILLLIAASIFVVRFNKTAPRQETSAPKEAVAILAQNLEIPWDVDFLPASAADGPDGQMLATELPGRLILLGDDFEQTIRIQGVKHVGEGGLLGLAVHPDFSSNHFVYLYLTSDEAGRLSNRVERYRLEGSQLSERKVIFEGIRGAAVHDGGQLAFGPDGFLYISTGDAGQSATAQDKNSLNGKILRLKDDGSIPDDNPFGNAVYSYGHRNVQGLAWDDVGQLWATEHGPSGTGSGFDELNLIIKGGNYGWPVIKGDQIHEGMISPVIQSGANETWAPAGIAFYKNKIYFVGLRGETLYRAEVSEHKVVKLDRLFAGEFGRLRALTVGPDNLFYITTSNRDGRGSSKANDDKIIRIDPGQIK